jgi:hypothetical protein
MQRITVSANRRFLITEDGAPFFWLGETAWGMFQRLDEAETRHYLETRRDQGFNVIQAVALAEADGLRVPNASGDLPLIDLDPARPNEAYFRHMDWAIRYAESLGLYIGLLPTWGDKVTQMWGLGPVIFDVDTAYSFGRYLAERYREQTNIIWILGGDRPAVHEDRDYAPVWRAMAAGIRAVLGHRALIAFHPCGGRSSSMWLHHEPWLDVNMWQSGHMVQDAPNWTMIADDYALHPPKPTMDSEPNYEDHPINAFTRQWIPEYGYYRDLDVRKQAYRAVFAGACGHTYGHHAVWQFYAPPRLAVNYPDRTWQEALRRPGAEQLRHLRTLIESRPFLARIPDQSLLVDPGDGAEHGQATRDSAGTYALIYLPPLNRPVQIDPSKLAGDTLIARWYDPRTGQTHDHGTIRREVQSIQTPDAGQDWVLMLDVQS